MARLSMAAKIRRLFALWAICLDRPVPKLVLCGFRLTDVAECNTEPTSPCLIGFRYRGSHEAAGRFHPPA